MLMRVICNMCGMGWDLELRRFYLKILIMYLIRLWVNMGAYLNRFLCLSSEFLYIVVIDIYECFFGYLSCKILIYL